jgi:poly(U)-specific endoribonuclease
MNFIKVEQFYREIYRGSGGNGDEDEDHNHPMDLALSLPHELLQQIHDFLVTLNPPPDTLMKLRASAFKVASQYLQETNDKVQIRSLLRQIHGIVQTIHTTFYNAVMSDRNDGTSNADSDEEIRTLLNQLLDEMKLDTEENERLLSFLRSQPASSVRLLLSLVFIVGHEHFQSNNDSGHNEQVFRCMNVMVHAIETVFYRPKPYRLQLSTATASSYSAMAAVTASGRTNESGGGGSDSNEPTTSTSIAYSGNNHLDLASMSLNDAAQQLWNYDANRLVMNDDLHLNVQNGKKPYVKEDAANDPLFTKVDPDVFRRSTYAAFLRLLDNYHSATGIAEQITSMERDEIHQFLSIIMETAPMQFCYQYCKAHQLIAPPSSNHRNEDDSSIEDFKQLLYTIWFEPYSRDGNERDSSGFEHVFIGEVQDNAISGFHNWIQFYHQEQKGNIDYRGYIKPRGAQSKYNASSGSNHQSDDHLLTLQFAWKNTDNQTYVEKFVGTMFIGVSPEFEMALYTMCFLFGQEENTLTLDTGADVYEVVIKCYTIARGKIGTTFPEVISHYDDNDN